MPYRAPVSEFRFVLDQIVGLHQVAETALFAEATPDTVEAILSEAGKLSETVLAPNSPRGWKTGSSAHRPALPRGSAPLPKAAGWGFRPTPNMAAWVCPWR